jgi:hypothetical protein
MQPFRRVVLVTLHGTFIRVNTGKLDIIAQVITALITEETVFTGNTRFDGHPVTYQSISSNISKFK